MAEERRNLIVRAAVVQRIVNDVVQNPSVMLSVAMLQQWLGVSVDAARRILERLVASGLVSEIDRGVWAKRSLGAGPAW